MVEISLIAALDEAGGLGFNNQLLCHLPADLHHFKLNTLNKPIIMGRKTFESIGKALPGRKNIVLSNSFVSQQDITIVTNLDKALTVTNEAPEIMIIGGAQVFLEAMPIATRLYITKIHHHFTADVFFPKIDKTLWSCNEERFRAHDEKNKYDMTFYIYHRAKVKNKSI